MIIDRIILFFFGKGPQAEQEEAARLARELRAAGTAAGAGQAAPAPSRWKRAAKRLKKIAPKRKRPRKKSAKKSDDMRDDKKAAARRKKSAAGKKRTSAKRTSTKRASPRRAKKKIARKKTRAAKKAQKKIAKKKIIRKAVKKKTAAKKISKKKTSAKKITSQRAAKKKKSARQKGTHRDIHVVYRREEGLWALLREGSARSDSLYISQADAIDAGRSRARHEQVELIIHRRDGSIRDSHTSR